MNDSIQDNLDYYRSKLYDLSRNNPFINVKENKIHFLGDSDSGLARIYSKANFFRKEYGLNTTLKIHSFLKWREPGKDYFFTSPLLVEKCSVQRSRKIELSYSIKIEDEENTFLNPILLHSLQRFYDVHLVLDSNESLFQQLKRQLAVKSNDIEYTSKWNNKEFWQVIEISAIGNFNYKKSLLGKDYETFSQHPNDSIKKILGFKETQRLKSRYDRGSIVKLDFSQKEVVALSSESNAVIQGPPGTGKSHTIVGLIGAYLLSDKKVLFVSQKKSSLDVVFERLKKLKLEHLVAYLNTEKDEKKQFYKNLKKSWDYYSRLHEGNQHDRLIEHKSLVDFYTSDFIVKNEKFDCSPAQILKDLSLSRYSKDQLVVDGPTPNFMNWQKSLNDLRGFEALLRQEFDLEYIANASFLVLNKSIFSETEPTNQLEQRLKKCYEVLDEINAVQQKYNLDTSIQEISKLAITSSILNLVNRSQLDLLNVDSKKYKSFGSAAKKFELLNSKLVHSLKSSSKWKTKPSKSEISELTDLLKHNAAPKGIWGIIKRRNERLTRAFDSFDPGLSDQVKIQLLEQLRVEWNLIAELDEVKIKLKHNFGIIDPENEVRQILLLRNKLTQIEKTDYLRILEHDESIELIQDLNALHPKIQNYNHIVKFTFDYYRDKQIIEERILIQDTLNLVPKIRLFEVEFKSFFSLPSDVQSYIRLNHQSIEYLDNCCAYYQLIEEYKYNPFFKQINGQNLQKSLKNEQLESEVETKNNINQIKDFYASNWKQIEEILSTPASKLKDDEKALKKRLKNQKRTFIHEVNKKQRHLPVNEYVSSNWEFTSSFIPIWFMNPLAVSEKLPLIKDIFDVVIFDESSQIPIEDALPAIHRSQQIVVVGDDYQMPPSAFFQNSSSSETVLDQAGKVFDNHMLKWHYRSEHPALINFSNSYFYENELQTIPPVSDEIPIKLNLVPGTFEDGVNKVEAKSIAKLLMSIGGNRENEIAVVAFSKTQENEIRNELKNSNLDIDQLLISNLENVQGIERDVVIISIGYAKNPEGQFRLNFGPINQEGGQNRLNVLFSRARKEMQIFASISSNDFGLSENPGVTCLKDFLFYCESLDTDSCQILDNSTLIDLDYYRLSLYSPSEGLGIRCYIQHDSNRILLLDPGLDEHDSSDINTVFSVLSQRFTKTMILLSSDYFNNPEKFKLQLDNFFL